jgi:hypothetical protein
MAYVYRHIRLDKNEPFYIGISNDIDYKRASSKKRRNNIWNSIANKTDYEVEIMLDGLTWDEACKKEIELIKLYGRSDLKLGTLSNMTIGGEGAIDKIITDEFRNKCKISKIGNLNPNFGKKAWNTGLQLTKWNHTEETKNKLKVPKNKTNCPNCGLYGAVNQLKRWHFDNCKNKKINE